MAEPEADGNSGVVWQDLYVGPVLSPEETEYIADKDYGLSDLYHTMKLPTWLLREATSSTVIESTSAPDATNLKGRYSLPRVGAAPSFPVSDEPRTFRDDVIDYLRKVFTEAALSFPCPVVIREPEPLVLRRPLNWKPVVLDAVVAKTEPACPYCNDSHEGQRWNEQTRMMETVPGGCTHCGEEHS